MKLVGLFLLGMFGLASDCVACSCVPTTVELRLQRSTEVFVGTVLSVKRQQRSVKLSVGTVTVEDVRARIRVEQSWKGTHRDTVEVGTVSSTCGVVFQEGKRLLVFAHTVYGAYGELKSRLGTTICSGSRVVRWTADTTDSLGTPLWERRGGP